MIYIKKTAYGSVTAPRFWSYEIDGDSLVEYIVGKNGTTTTYKTVRELSKRRLAQIFGLDVSELSISSAEVTDDTDVTSECSS